LLWPGRDFTLVAIVVVTIGQIASYVPGAGGGTTAAGASAAGASGKTALGGRRRGARGGRDNDRVSMAEDVPEYKGSLPVEELLAFVEGSVQSPPGSTRIPPPNDSKLRRTKRKDAGDVDQLKLRCNGDTRVEVDVPAVPSELACLPHSEPLNGLLNGSSSKLPASKLVSDLPVQDSNNYGDDNFLQDEWLSSELASHLMFNESHDDGIVKRKEKEFILVQKKRRLKIASPVNGDSTKSIEPRNGFCLGKNATGYGKEECAYMNGFHVEEIQFTNGSTVSRNWSEGSLAQSLDSSDIDDLSHFVGEDGFRCGDAGMYVDAAVSWNSVGDDDDDDKEDSLSSFCSTMSSAESRQRLNSPSSHQVVSPDIDETEVLPQDGLYLSSKQQPHDNTEMSAGPDLLEGTYTTYPVQRLSTLSTGDGFHRCTDLCCVVPYKHAKHQIAVMFCDSQGSDDNDVSDVVFSFGCTLTDHLTSGGLCTEAAHAEDLTESELNGDLCCDEQGGLDTASSCGGGVCFMYSDSIPQFTSSSSPPCIDQPLPNSAQTYKDEARSRVGSGSVKRFQVCDVQSYMLASKCLSR